MSTSLLRLMIFLDKSVGYFLVPVQYTYQILLLESLNVAYIYIHVKYHAL